MSLIQAISLNANDIVDLRASTAGALLVSSSDKYHTNDVDVASSTITYVGGTDPSGAWQIQKIDTTSGTSIRYAVGTTGYSTNWTNRASLTYTL